MRLRPARQLALPLAGERRDAIARLPFPIAWHKVRRAVRRQLRHTSESEPLIAVCRLLEGASLLEQVRQRARAEARKESGRNSRLATAAYLGTPEGQRVARVMAALSERLTAQEAQLCG